VQTLAESVQHTNSDVADAKQQAADLVAEARQTEKSVKAIESGLRESCKAMLYPNMFLVAEVKTIWGIPRPLYDDIQKNMDTLASFAYPDKKERDQEIAKIKARMPGSANYGR
jgi:hypothetical protein